MVWNRPVDYSDISRHLSERCVRTLSRDGFLMAAVKTSEALIGQQRQALNLLLLEDNPYDVRQFMSVVRPEDAAVTVVDNGAEALDRVFHRGRFQNYPAFDLVVADLNVPLLNGHEVLNVIKSNSSTRHIPVIVWTVSENPSDVRKAFELGCCAYLIKPTDIDESEALLRALKEFWLRSSRYPVMLNRAHGGAAVRKLPLSA